MNEEQKENKLVQTKEELLSLEKETKRLIYEDSNPEDNHQQRKNISSFNETNISENVNNNDSLETNPNMTMTNDEKELQKLSKELEELKLLNQNQQFQNSIEGQKQSSVSAEDIIFHKEKLEENNFEEPENNKVKPNGLGTAGAILSIIGASFWIFIGVITIIFLIGIPILIGAIFDIKFALKFMKDFEYKTKSGILSIFFGGLISGIFILVSQSSDEKQ